MVRKKSLKKDEKGAIGIEILIVFIAIVLVAAVSAAVLIQTVGFLQQKAVATGRDTTKEVASGVKVFKVMGYVTSPKTATATVDKLAIYIEPNTGGQDIDLSAVVVRLSDGTKEVMLTYNSSYFIDNPPYDDVFNQAAYPTTQEFGVIVLQDEDGSLSGNYPVMNRGDKVIIAINTSAILNGIDPRTGVSGEVRPEFGAPGIIEFTTPPAYTENIVELQ